MHMLYYSAVVYIKYMRGKAGAPLEPSMSSSLTPLSRSLDPTTASMMSALISVRRTTV